MTKRIISVVTVLLLLSAMAMSISALEEPDMSRTGSISIVMTYQEQPVPGGSLTLYRVADVHEENGADYSFRLTEEYADSQISLDSLDDSTVASSLAAYAKDMALTGTKKTIDQDGAITFSELELGLYLLVQEDPAKGYLAVSPFLVSVPAYKDGSYIYDVDGSPKLALEIDPTPPPPPPPPDIPQTGLNQWPIPVMAAGGLVLVVLGWYLCIAGRKQKREA